MVLSAVFTLMCIKPPTEPIDTNTNNTNDSNTNANIQSDIYASNEYFASKVVSYCQAPGQFANSSTLCIASNYEKVLGPPVGGGKSSPNHSSCVSLGMAGGYIVVEFSPPIENHVSNIGGYDFIVFGNAIDGGASTWREPGIIWVMKDENNNGTNDDTWYLIAGYGLSNTNAIKTISYNRTNASVAPNNKNYFPSLSYYPNYADETNLSYVSLPTNIYGIGITDTFGYADCSPTLILGDTNGDNTVDISNMVPHLFYTIPDTPSDGVYDEKSGGGDAIKIEWAVDANNFTNVYLDKISWLKIVSTSTNEGTLLGEYSTEVDAISRVRRER